MGAYSFKPRFVPYVLDWSKTHTIRAERANGDKPGNVLHLFTAMRTQNCRLLMRAECVKVEPIQIYERGDGTFGVVIGREELTPDEKDALAWRDGFRDRHPEFVGAFVQMIRFWMAEHGAGRMVEACRANHKVGEPRTVLPGPALAFKGHIIHWNPEVQYAKVRSRVVRIEHRHPLYVKGAAA